MKRTRFILSESSRSHSEIHRLLMAALNADHPMPANTIGGVWIREVYDDRVIYEIEGGEKPTLYSRPYVIADDDAVTLGEPVEVTVETSFVPVREGVTPQSGALIEALDDDGWRWRVQVITAGTSRNGNEYPLPVLHNAAPLYEGVPVFPEHDAKHRGVRDLLGVITESTPNDRGIEATYEVARSRPETRDLMRQAWDVKQRTGKDLFGFSHSVRKFRSRPRSGRGRVVESIDEVESVDLVMQPAAGGALLAPIVAAESFVIDALQEAIMNVSQLLAKLREGKRLSMEELAFLQENIGGDEFAAALAEGQQPAPAQPATPAPNLTEAEDRIAKMLADAENRAKLAECRATLTAKLAESKLPEKVKTAIAEDFDGRLFESDELDKRIQRDREMAASLADVRPHGLGAVTVTEDQREKHQKALDGLIEGRAVDGVSPFTSIKQAHRAITGGSRFDPISDASNRAVLADIVAYHGNDPLLMESIDSSTFGQMLGDSITRRMIREYAMPDRQTWRAISDVVPVNDFRTQRRARWGGYDLLPVVGEGGTYQPLTSPGDEEATDSLDKYGGLEAITIEAIANDDVRQLRNIPRKLGQAAADTLYNAVWVTTIAGNATASYDSVALYDNAHSNTGTAALDEAGLKAVRIAMRSQLAYGDQSGLPLGEANTPRVIAVPNELEIQAYKLTQSAVAVTSNANATEPNFFNNALNVVVVDAWSDATDWYAFADPARMPTLEVGFYQGREEPELFVQDAQTVGSVFTADKVTYKVRHIWYVMVVDHRATYRQVVSN